ncbi:MAG: sulfite exporter TauE/SafE family protein [Promethearchaeota archaeon]
MELELYQIVILIIAGGIVGISMSFIGQTGSGIVIPIVFILTGDILLAIAINILNDLIAASVCSIYYLIKKNYIFTKDNFILIAVSALTSLLCVYILITTNLSSSFSILLPLVFIIGGLYVFKNGFPTAASIKETVHKITEKFLKNKKSEDEIKEIEKKMDQQLLEGENITEGLIKRYSKPFYIATIIVGIILGGNSGLFGASGGLIIVLALIIISGYPLKKSVGTGLVVSAVICLCTFTIYQIFGTIIKGRTYFDLTISFYLAIGAISVGIISSIYVQKLSAKAMGMGMGTIMVILGIATLIIHFVNIQI